MKATPTAAQQLVGSPMPDWFPASCQLERYPGSSGQRLGLGAHDPVPVKRTHGMNPQTMLVRLKSTAQVVRA